METDSSIKKNEMCLFLEGDSVLTKYELECLMGNKNYYEYLEDFLKLKFSQFSSRNSLKLWFKERYLNGFKENNKAPHKSTVFIKVINYDRSLQDAFDEFLNYEGVEHVYGSHRHQDTNFSLDLFLNLSPNIDAGEVMESLPKSLNMVSFDIAKLNIKNTYPGKVEDLIGIYKLLFSLDHAKGTEDDLISDSSVKTVESVTDILQSQFNFCTTCAKQYDSKAEMAFMCSVHHLHNTTLRSLSIFSSLSNISFNIERYVPKFNIIKTFLDISYKESIRCLECNELFRTIDAACVHYHSSHAGNLELNSNLVLLDSLLVSNMDFFALNHLLGTYTKIVPSYAKYVSDEYVIYDMPEVFSGSIDLSAQ